MDLKNFDKQIKSTLENLEAPFDSASWQALENRMNQAFTEEQPAAVEPVDLIAKRALERLETPFMAADWSIMNNLLNQRALVRRIKVSKTAEVAIFLLLLINIQGFLGGFKEVLKPAAPAAPKAVLPMADAQPRKNSKQRNASAAHHDASASLASRLAEQVVALIASPFTSTDNTSNITAETEAASQIITTNVAANSSLLDGANFYTTSGIVPFHKLEKLPQAQTADFAWKNFLEKIPGVIVPTPNKSNGFYAASFVSFENNKVRNPDFSTQENGYGGGVAVGYRKGKWGVEAGVAYSHKTFTPQQGARIYAGSPTTGFWTADPQNIDADVMSIPVKVTRRFARVGRTSAHAVGGVSVSAATEKRILNRVAYLQPPVTVGVTDYAPPPENKGLFEGGSVRSNVYATADLGVRVEQKLGRRYTAFVEPAYRHALGSGFGPKSERVNTIAIQAGIMAAL